MREVVQAGYGEYYVKADLNVYNSTTVENRSSAILSLYSDAIYATFPVFTEGKEFNINYEHIGGNKFLGKVTISFRVGNAETKFAEYNRLVKYVQNDIQILYSKGLLNNNMTNRQKALAVAEYISLNMEYDQSLNDKAHNPIGFYEGWKLVCDGYAGLFNVFMQELGFESYVISGSADGPHAWNLTKLDGQWLISDVTFADPVFYYNNVLTQEFNKDYIARTASDLHKVDKDTMINGYKLGNKTNSSVSTINLTTGDITEDAGKDGKAKNLWYTEARVSANTDVANATAHIKKVGSGTKTDKNIHGLSTDDLTIGTNKFVTQNDLNKLANVPANTNSALNKKLENITIQSITNKAPTTLGQVTTLAFNTFGANVTVDSANKIATIECVGQLDEDDFLKKEEYAKAVKKIVCPTYKGPASLKNKKLADCINAFLPEDVKVSKAEEVGLDFDARFHAK